MGLQCHKTQLDVFYLILRFLQIFRIDLWWNLGIFFRKKHHKPILRFCGSHRSRPRLAPKRRDAEIKLFSAQRWLVVFRRETTSPDRLVQIHCFCASWTSGPPHLSMIGDMKSSCVSMPSASPPVHIFVVYVYALKTHALTLEASKEKIVSRTLEGGGQSDPPPPLLIFKQKFIRLTWNLVHIVSFICTFQLSETSWCLICFNVNDSQINDVTSGENLGFVNVQILFKSEFLYFKTEQKTTFSYLNPQK